MVSPPNTAVVSPNSAVSALQSIKDVVAPAPAATPVSKQNTAGVPKLHSASFQNFGDALKAALSHRDAPSHVEKASIPGIDSANPAAAPRPSITMQLPITNQPPITEQTPGTESGTPVYSGPEAQAAPKSQSAGRQADPHGITMGSLVAKHASLFDLPSGGALAKMDVEPGSHEAQLDRHTNVNSSQITAEVAAQITQGNSDAGSPEPLQADRLNRLRPAALPAPNEHAVTGQDFGISESETQAFQLNLHSDSEINQANRPTHSAAETIVSNAIVSGSSVTQPPEIEPGEKIPEATQTGNLRVEQSREQTAVSAASSDARGTTAPASGPATLSRREPATASPDESKQGQKLPGDAAPEPPKNWMTSAPTGLDSGVRISGTPRVPLEPPRSAESLRNGATPTTNEAKEVLVRFQNGPGGAVTVRLVDQGGQIQVAVRSTDPVAAAQLRQDLGSLTNSLERYGWKTDVTAVPALQNPTTHDAQPSRGDTQGGNQEGPDWNEGRENRRRSSGDLWEAVFANQNA